MNRAKTLLEQWLEEEPGETRAIWRLIPCLNSLGADLDVILEVVPDRELSAPTDPEIPMHLGHLYRKRFVSSRSTEGFRMAGGSMHTTIKGRCYQCCNFFLTNG